MTPQERIKADAERYTKDEWYQRVYIAGATAEHAQNESVRLQLEAQDANVEILLSQKKELIEKAQVLVDALEALKEGAENHTIHFIDKILKQWKSGKGKEVGDE